MKAPMNTCFTIFTENLLEPDMDKIEFLAYQKEECPTTKRIHLQCYCECKKQLSVGQLKTALKSDVNIANVEKRKGSQKQAIEYVTKEDTRVEGPWQHGTPKRCLERERTDLNVVAEAIESGASISDIADSNPKQFIMYNKGIRALKSIKTKNRNFKTHVTWIYGSSGKGKTRLAWDLHPDAYPKNNSEWWDGYDPDIHEAVIIDDYRIQDKIRFSELLRLFDRYPHLVQQKGATVSFKPKHIVLTTTKSPQETFFGFDEHMQQLLRRIDEIIDLDEDPEDVDLTR